MPDQMDTALTIQRATLVAQEREALIRRARGTPSPGSLVTLVGGLLFTVLMSLAAMYLHSWYFLGPQWLGLLTVILACHRISQERLAAVISLLDEEKHGPKEAWIRRLQRPAEDKP